MTSATFYKLRMSNGDEHVTRTDPRGMSGDWAVIRIYKQIADRNFKPIGWFEDGTLTIRPAHIVSYVIFDDDKADYRPAGIPRNPLETPFMRLSPTIPYQCPRLINKHLNRGLICDRRNDYYAGH